jgi:hypothetical protein
VFAWAAVRYGELYAYIASVNLTREGVSIHVYIRAKSWRQRWSKDEAINLVANYLRRGEWVSIFAAWLGDGKAGWREVLRGMYQLVITAKEPWRLGKSIDARNALVARGKEAFIKLREATGPYGVLLDILQPHKWINIKLVTDDDFRAVYKMKKRGIDVLRETYGRNNGEISTEQFLQMDKQRKSAVVVAGVVMSLYLVNGQGGSLMAARYTRDAKKALAIAEKLELAGLRPNVVKAGSNYVVYIATADLLKLAEEDDTVRRAIALYLAEKAKNGTPRQRKIAEKLLKRIPLLTNILLLP